MHVLVCYVTLLFPYSASPVITAIEPNSPTTRGGSSNSYVIPTGVSGVVLSCSVFGVPPPEVQWVTAKGLPLPDYVTSVMSLSGSHDLNHVTAQLKWGHGFNSSDAGGYSCVASSSAGNVSQPVTLTIGTNSLYCM